MKKLSVILYFILLIGNFAQAAQETQLFQATLSEADSSKQSSSIFLYVVGGKDIKSVTYRLHPTFKPPVRKIATSQHPQYPFSLSLEIYGDFVAVADIHYVDGSVTTVIKNVFLHPKN